MTPGAVIYADSTRRISALNRRTDRLTRRLRWGAALLFVLSLCHWVASAAIHVRSAEIFYSMNTGEHVSAMTIISKWVAWNRIYPRRK